MHKLSYRHYCGLHTHTKLRFGYICSLWLWSNPEEVLRVLLLAVKAFALIQSNLFIISNFKMIDDPHGNETVINNAPWLGFLKTDEVNRSVPSLVKWNIIYIIVVTSWSIVLVRQYNYRASRGRPTTRAFFMFPNITRHDADKDLEHCLKYLANYGFYKFGLEVSLNSILLFLVHRVWSMVLYEVLHNFIWSSHYMVKHTISSK